MVGVDALAGAWPRVRPALRLGLALLWLVWAVSAWWTAPRVATVERALADAAADQVVGYQWAESFRDVDSGSLWLAPAQLAVATDAPSPLIVWRTGFGRAHYAPVDPSPRRSPQAQLLGTAFPASRNGEPISHLPSLVAVAIALVCFLILIQGPAPGLGTRWFWFWLGGLPFGLGVLLWLAAERPWTEPEPPSPDKKTGQPKRYSALTGLALVIVAVIVFSLLLALP
jgi:hypothetical protein